VTVGGNIKAVLMDTGSDIRRRGVDVNDL